LHEVTFEWRFAETPYKVKKEQSLQEKYAPRNICFGCGAANPDGLHIRSFLKNSDESRAGGEVVAEWKPEKKYEAFEGVLNGGIIGTLLDCHCNWTAAYHLMKHAGENRPPCTVTAEYAIKLLRPTPTNDSVFLSAKVVEITDDRATIEGTLTAGGKVCATCRGVFVAVKEGHPAYHRW
jgi:acyl-coenzyme A thioesterase PaaI-like protein